MNGGMKGWEDGRKDEGWGWSSCFYKKILGFPELSCDIMDNSMQTELFFHVAEASRMSTMMYALGSDGDFLLRLRNDSMRNLFTGIFHMQIIDKNHNK